MLFILILALHSVFVPHFILLKKFKLLAFPPGTSAGSAAALAAFSLSAVFRELF